MFIPALLYGMKKGYIDHFRSLYPFLFYHSISLIVLMIKAIPNVCINGICDDTNCTHTDNSYNEDRKRRTWSRYSAGWSI